LKKLDLSQDMEENLSQICIEVYVTKGKDQLGFYCDVGGGKKIDINQVKSYELYTATKLKLTNPIKVEYITYLETLGIDEDLALFLCNYSSENEKIKKIEKIPLEEKKETFDDWVTFFGFKK